MPVRPGVPAEVVLYFAGILDPLDHLTAFSIFLPPRYFFRKVFKKGDMSVDPALSRPGLRIKEEARR